MKCHEILIIGMHHTGTSILANLTMSMGIYGGEYSEFIISRKNPMKFWERKDVVDINQKRFEEFEKDADLPYWSGITYRKKGIPIHQKKESKLVVNKLNSHCNWVTKDPRFGLLLHEWMPLLKNPICVFVNRDKKETVNSLNSFHNNTYKWSQVYDRYYNESYNSCIKSKTPIINISNNDLLYRPNNVIKDLYNFWDTNNVNYKKTAYVQYKRKDEAYATLITGSDENYIIGASVLIESIHSQDTKRDIVCMVTDNVNDEFIKLYIERPYVKIIKVDKIEEFWFDTCSYKRTKDKQKRWGNMMTKLNLWNLPYEKVLYLDTDTILLDSMDNLKDGNFSLMAQTGLNHKQFNAGVLLLKPNKKIFEDLMSYKNKRHPQLYSNIIDCTEQALLNDYFKDYKTLEVARPEKNYVSTGKESSIHWITNWCPKPWYGNDYTDCNTYYYKLWNKYLKQLLDKNKVSDELYMSIINENYQKFVVRSHEYEILLPHISWGRRLSEWWIRDHEYESENLTTLHFLVFSCILFLFFVLVILASLSCFSLVKRIFEVYEHKKNGFEIVGKDYKITSCVEDEEED
jgi:hypothetical protein